METLLRRIYVGQKYPHIYMLSINTSKYRSIMIIYILTIIVQVHCYHRAWYNITWILHHQQVQKFDLLGIIQVWIIQKVLTSYNWDLESRAGAAERKRLQMVYADPSRFRYATLIYDRIPRIPSSGIWTCRYRDFQNATQWVHKIKPSDVHRDHMCTWI